MLDFQAARFLQNGEVAAPAGNDHPTLIPTGVFPTSDGHINIAASSARLWERLCAALGRADWQAVPDWQTQEGRSRARQAINAAIGEVTRRHPSAHWIALFEGAGIPCGPINTIDRVFADPQVQHLAMARPVSHPRLGDQQLVGSAISMSGIARDIRSASPDAGAQTDEVLREVGYTDAEIGQMRNKGATE
jgi:formyl-CoA transferase